MSNSLRKKKLSALGQLVNEIAPPVTFRMMEIGALPITSEQEPFYQLLDLFPGSEIIAFEIEKKVCDELNARSRPGVRYYPMALGGKEATCPFYETVHPMCSSLYRPNEDLLSVYQNLEVAMLKSVGSVETVSLDFFCKNNGIDDLDFIKIDIQGAELDVFKGGKIALGNVTAIVSEVEFVPLYHGQPLFGDVCEYLDEQHIMFHKFLGMAGRTIKPYVIEHNINFPSQHMWTDALYIRNIRALAELPAHKVLKMGVLAYMYGSPDVAYHCFRYFDHSMQTRLCEGFVAI